MSGVVFKRQQAVLVYQRAFCRYGLRYVLGGNGAVVIDRVAHQAPRVGIGEPRQVVQ
ncbi:MAG TPA: hypothetical protein QF901_07850 [Gammaproteobacteria bacterium]|nr:hypothetical protein [Gammaproteobacteria bacterium]